MKKKHSKSFFLAWIFGALAIILTVALTIFAVIIIRLQRNNMFSKSILLDNNYFMGQVMYDVSNTSADGEKTDKKIYPGEYPDVYAGGYYKEYYVYGADGSFKVVAEQVDPDIASRVKKISDIIVDEVPDYIKNDKTYSVMIVNMLCQIYEINGITPEADIEVQKYLTQFGIELELENVPEAEEVLIDVPYISQEGILPNGCEAVSATMLLRRYGFDISPEDFVDGFLECGETSIRFGCRIGPNPKEVYAGDPRSESGGFGCFAPVIVRALNSYLPDGYYAKNTTGLSLETLKRRYIDNGIPVMVWVTVGMEEVDRILQWQSEDGEETYLYPANEHCMVFVGYNEDEYIFNDPYGSNGVVSYPIDDCVLAFNMLGSQSIAILSTSGVTNSD